MINYDIEVVKFKKPLIKEMKKKVTYIQITKMLTADLHPCLKEDCGNGHDLNNPLQDLKST